MDRVKDLMGQLHRKTEGWRCLYAISLIMSIVPLFLCSQSSPLYPINSSIDVNINFTVGRSILDGLMPYRDLYDHKGPALYSLYYIASLISRTDYKGVFLIELACFSWFLVMTYRTIRLFHDGRMAVKFLPLVSSIICASNTFCQGAVCEEFVLPFLAASLFLVLRARKEQRLLRYSEIIMIGAFCGTVFWMKYTLCGLFIGLFICMEGKRRNLLSAIGFLAVSAIILIPYAAVIRDMFQVYFYDNIFHYHNVKTMNNLAYYLVRNILFIVVVACSLTFHEQRKVIAVGMLCMAAFIFGGLNAYQYYFLPFSIFLCFGLLALSPKLPNIIALALSIAFLAVSPDIEGAWYPEMAGYLGPDDDILCCHSTDAGFYLISGAVPRHKYFTWINTRNDELGSEQDRLLKEGIPDVVITQMELKKEGEYRLVTEENGYWLYRKD